MTRAPDYDIWRRCASLNSKVNRPGKRQKNADNALLKAKAQGRGDHQFFQTDKNMSASNQEQRGFSFTKETHETSWAKSSYR
jgi:hypothetical protein